MGKKIEHFTDVEAWKHGHRLVTEICNYTKNFPREEVFGLTGQIRRAASSVTTSIAEGMGRYSYKERVRSLHNSRGSTFEVENFAILARDLVILMGRNSTFESTDRGNQENAERFINSTERLVVK